MSFVRGRWAAIGAAVAVTLGAGGLMTASASGSQSVFVAITPTRVLDTRYDVGLTDAFRGDTARKLDITGTIDYVASTNPDFTPNIDRKTVVPDGATAIVANLTVTQPTNTGFVSIRPGNATGRPSTSNINIPAPGSDIPNSVTVELPTSGPLAGHVDLYYNRTGATTHLILDIVGYYTEGTGTPGPAGPAGPAGPTGPAGPAGADGIDAESPARVIWVADDGTGDFTSLSAALASITDNSITNPYLIRIAPGTYTETETIDVPEYVRVLGSGRTVTTIRCNSGCATLSGQPAGLLNLRPNTEIGDLTVENRSPGDQVIAILVSGEGTIRLIDLDIDVGTADSATGLASIDATGLEVSGVEIVAEGAFVSTGIELIESDAELSDIDVTAAPGTDSATNMTGVFSSNSAVTMHDVAATATGGNFATAIEHRSSQPVMSRVTATAQDALDTNIGVLLSFTVGTMTDVSATAEGGITSHGFDGDGGLMEIRDSRFSGTTTSLNRDRGGWYVFDTLVSGPVASGFYCQDVYTTSLLPVTCT